MKKGVSGSGVVFGRVVIVEEGGRGVQKCASTLIRIRNRSKTQCVAGGELFRYRLLVELKISKLKIKI